MSSYSIGLTPTSQSNGPTVSSVSPGAGFPTSNGGTASNVSVLNNGPSLGSSLSLPVTGSPTVGVARPTSQPEQIIVPVGNLMSHSKVSQSPGSHTSPAVGGATSTNTHSPAGSEVRILDRSRLRELVKEVDPLEQMDDDVEDVLLQVADDFIENVVAASCQLAKHRRSNTLEAKDVQLYLERSWNMQIPGFGSDEIRPYKRSLTTEAHKQRMALIRKTIKKY